MRITESEMLAQLPERTQILRLYNSFEKGDLRVIVQEPGEDFEKRYTVDEVDGKPKLRHMP
jgi:hypothetical protein